MYENKHEPPVSIRKFAARLTGNLLLALGILVFSLLLGTYGYHYFGYLKWVDAFYNSCMILTGMGPVDIMNTSPAKLFASFYALYSGIAFLTTIAVIVVPVLHRAMHKFHFKTDD